MEIDSKGNKKYRKDNTTIPKMRFALGMYYGKCKSKYTLLFGCLQSPVNYNLFSRPSLSNIGFQALQQAILQPIILNGSTNLYNRQPVSPNPAITRLLSMDIQQQNKRAMEMHNQIASNYHRQQEILEEVKRDFQEQEFYEILQTKIDFEEYV